MKNMRHVLILLALLIAPVALHAQAVRFDSNSYTTNSSCVAGNLCPVLAIPGTRVNFCSGTQSTLALCLSNPATTYTSFTAGTACSTTAQVTPATGSNTCTSTSNNQGDFGAWFLPGQYAFYLRPPTSAGGGTYGPYPINVGAGAVCGPATCDVNYQTLAAACTAAGTGTLFITRTWSALTTQTLACNIETLANGIIKPASGQTVTLSGSFDGSLTQHFDLSAGGAILVTNAVTKALEAQWFGVVGDNTTNNTTKLSAGLTTAMNSSKPFHFPEAPGYLACGSTVAGTGPMTIYGDGEFLSTIKPFGGAAACTTALTITTTGNVNLHDFGCQYGFTGHTLTGSSCINITGPGTTNNLTAPNSVTVEHMYFSQAKSVGLQCQPCQNVSLTNSIFYQNYWFGASFASSGTVLSHTTLRNFNIHGNTFIDTGIGVGLSFFLSNISVTGNVFDKSNLSLVQIPHAYATIEGNTFDGVPDTGCYIDSQCGSLSGAYNAIFLEGVSDWSVGVNYISGIDGAAGVLGAAGSNLTIGTQMELPTSHGHVDGLVIEDSTAGFPLLIGGTSNGPNPIVGVDITVKNTKLSNVNECPNVGGAIGVEVSNNYCNGAVNGGFILGNIQNGTFKNNTCRNCNTAGGTTYTTGTLSATNGSATLTGSGTVWSSGMVGGGITIAGTTYQILSRASNTSIDLTVPYAGTSGSGLSYSIHYGGGLTYPGVNVNGTGTHLVQVSGNTFQNDSGNGILSGINDATGLSPAVSLITYDTTNTCTGSCGYGIILPVPTLGPTFTSCGTSPIPATYNNNAQGLVVIGGGGAVSSCTMVFANSGFNQAPACNFISSNAALTFGRAAGTSGLQFVFATGGAADMQGVSVQYSCSSAAGSVSAGWYPYATPY